MAGIANPVAWMLSLVVAGVASVASGATLVTINSNTFDLDQFIGASVTYRSDGSVAFDGKLWDNSAGVDGVSLGELAAGQAGGDPGDQVTLQSTGLAGPDWLQLNYAGGGIEVTATGNELILYEITSSSSGVDPEGTNFRIQFNGGAWHNASEGVATFLAGSTLPPPPSGANENTNQLVFDLLSFGFNPGDLLSTVRIENLDGGVGVSDPDFIFAGLIVPEPATATVLALAGVSLLMRRRAAC